MGVLVEDKWPAEDLERLDQCIICGSKRRSLLHHGLTDQTFFSAPGRWSFYQCSECRAGYLDPRPTAASIGRAYAGYYTHVASETFSPWRRDCLRAALQRGYLRRTYGHEMPDASPFGALAMRFYPRSARALDYLIRHLPAPRTPAARLLDIGCGSGNFLAIAQDLGFAVTGLEPDPDAVEAGRASGLAIRQGSLPGSGLPRDSFDHITLHHVLEHLHAPREALEEILGLLAPGGRLWLSQPNLDALGRERYGIHWRGLEAPRHLSLYGGDCLVKILEAIGYERVRILPASIAASFYFCQSVAMGKGIDPRNVWWPKGGHDEDVAAAARADRRALKDPSRAENLAVVAFRPA